MINDAEKPMAEPISRSLSGFLQESRKESISIVSSSMTGIPRLLASSYRTESSPGSGFLKVSAKTENLFSSIGHIFFRLP